MTLNRYHALNFINCFLLTLKAHILVKDKLVGIANMDIITLGSLLLSRV